MTDWTDQSEVEKLLALLPVHELHALSAAEQTDRRIAAYNLFGIKAVADSGGVSFEPAVGVLDQPLLAALDILFTRRFPVAPATD
ncbi:hypothetical protein [Microbacterium sulfonylureivorans]|uniref:hypothetical protein n=1 Tax=Microbacterium sulfonylureivorans TaxID=2486854 RepID=UPI000FDA7C16|nr:hypothetical protein [Microbacterium sulfonylureivorans]